MLSRKQYDEFLVRCLAFVERKIFGEPIANNEQAPEFVPALALNEDDLAQVQTPDPRWRN